MTAGIVVYTVGHSNQAQERLVAALTKGGIDLVVDVRSFPASRRNPQFNRDVLVAALPGQGIGYRHLPELGGRRRPRAGSANMALGDPGFRGFADYMATPEFEAGLVKLIEAAKEARAAIMCAETLPWRCHRSLIADALVARGVEVEHLIGGSRRRHALSPMARVEDGRVTYPALL